MIRLMRKKNGIAFAGRISSVSAVACLILSWSRPAFPDDKPHLQFAPINYGTTLGGTLGYVYQRNTLGTVKSSTQTLGVLVNAGIWAKTYIWQPWLAQVSGNLGVGFNTEHTRFGNQPASKSGGNYFLGSATLSVLQKSRFPFVAHAYQNNQQPNGFLAGPNSGYRGITYDLTQDYRSRGGLFDGSLNFGHIEIGRVGYGNESIENQLNLSITAVPFNNFNTLQVIGAAKTSKHPLQNDKSLNDTLVANHSYTPNSELSVGNLANLIKSSYKLTNPAHTKDYNSQQLSSFVSWRPEESPLTLTGSLRLLRVGSNNDGVIAPQLNDTNLNLGANYAWSSLLRMYGSVNVNDNNGIQTIATNAALSAQKGFGERLSPINVGQFRYTRSIGASLSNQTTTTSGGNQTTTTSVQQMGLNLGHALDKNTKLGGGVLSTNLNQGLATIVSTKGSPATRISTGGSTSWNHNESKGTTTVRVSAADSRSLTGYKEFFQFANLQASRDEDLGRHQTLLGNLTIQSSRSGRRGSSTPLTTSPSAELLYKNGRLFKIRNLTLNSSLKVIGADIVASQNLPAQTGASPKPAGSISWDNDMNYFIGLVKMRLYTHLAQVDKVNQSSIYFSITRSF